MTADEQQWIERRGHSGTDKEPSDGSDFIVSVIAWHGPLSQLAALCGTSEQHLRQRMRATNPGGRLVQKINLPIRGSLLVSGLRRRILATGEEGD
jgi:hypothetical protein